MKTTPMQLAALFIGVIVGVYYPSDFAAIYGIAIGLMLCVIVIIFEHDRDWW